MHCLTAWGQWAVQLLQCTGTLPGDNGLWNSCNAVPHCLWAECSAIFCNTLPHCLGTVGSAFTVMHCHSA